jgi:hypothetical protein
VLLSWSEVWVSGALHIEGNQSLFIDGLRGRGPLPPLRIPSRHP